MECLFEGAITRVDMDGGRGNGTYFNGEFVWAVMGSQSRIVRVGSKTHQEIVSSQVRREKQPIEELEVGGVYRTRKGEDYVLIGFGTGKGRKYLTQKVNPYRDKPWQVETDEGVDALGKPNVTPYWHYSGSFTAVEKIGQVNVPGGMPEAFDKKVAGVRASAAAWNRATSR